MQSKHIAETDLALYVSGDLSLLRRVSAHFHVRGCDRCRSRVEKYRADRLRVKQLADQMPEGVNWDRMAAEMTANIHVGLAAGECVARPNGNRGRDRRPLRVNWRPAAIMAGAIALMTVAWLMNMPTGTTEELKRAMSAVMHGHGSVLPIPAELDRRPVVVATQQGVELRENNNSMGGSDDARPVAVTVSMQGSASARYVNADTGQMTITSVSYVQ